MEGWGFQAGPVGLFEKVAAGSPGPSWVGGWVRSQSADLTTVSVFGGVGGYAMVVEAVFGGKSGGIIGGGFLCGWVGAAGNGQE